jgi:hypothetical protein
MYENDPYMQSVLEERARKEKERHEGEIHMINLVAKMKQDYFERGL